MNSKKIIWGSFLILIGIGYLLGNLNVIHFHFQWSVFSKYWSLILVAIGIHIIVKYSSKGKITFLLPIFYLILFSFFFGLFGNYENSNWNKDEESLNLDIDNSKKLSQEYDPLSKIINLKLEAGACEIALKDSTEKLLDMNFNDNSTDWNLERTKENAIENITIEMNKSKKIFGNHFNNSLLLKLNSNPIYNLDLHFGAGDCDFDFSKFKVENLKVRTGASDMNFKIGNKSDNVLIDLKSGVSDINIEVPKDFSCEIECSSALISKNFEGFKNKGNGIYQSDNFLSTQKMIKIKYSGGISDFEVTRY